MGEYGPIIQTKLEPPELAGMLPRGRLAETVLRKIGGGAGCRLVYLLAPAGWGKTMLMAQIYGELGRQENAGASWLSLDRADARPDRFVWSLAGAIERAGVKLDTATVRNTLVAGEAASAVDDAVLLLSQAIGNEARHHYLLLDSIHYVLGASWGLLVALLQNCPNLTLIATSRRPCDELCAAFAVRGQALTIGPSDLSFADEEIDRLKADIRPSSLLADMIKNLDGWPVAVTHSVELLKSMDRHAPVKTIDLQRRELSAFVRAEIFSDLTPEQRWLMVRLCMFRRFTREAILAVLDGVDTANLLSQLESEKGLIYPDSIRDGWLSVLAPVRRIVRTCLEQPSQKEQEDIHRKAFDWFHGRGYLTEAMAYAGYGGDTDQIRKVLRDDGFIEFLLKEGPSALERMLPGLPERVVEEYPILAATKALTTLRSNDVYGGLNLLATAKKGLIDVAELPQSAPENDLVDVSIQVYLIELIIQTYLDRPDQPDARKVLDWVIGLTSSRAQKFKGLAYSLKAFLKVLEGDLAGAAVASQQGMQGYQAAGSQTLSELYAFIATALVCLAQGDPADADVYHQQAIRQIPEVDYEDPGLVGILHLLECEILHDLGQTGDPAAILEILQEAERHEHFADVFVRGYTAASHAAFISEGPEAAQFILEKASRCARRLDIPRLSYRAGYLKAGYLTICGDLAAAESELNQLADKFDDGEVFWMERFCLLQTATRLQIARGDLPSAEKGIDALEALINRDLHGRCAMMVDLLRVELFAATRKTNEMVELFKSVLLRAAFSGLQGPLLEEGALLTVPLREIAARLRMDPGLSKAAPLVAKLVDRLNAGGSRRTVKSGPTANLTDQERRVIDLIRRGLTNKVVAYELGLAEATVKYHLRNIYRKFGVNNRVQAWAVTEGIAEFEAPGQSGEEEPV